MKNESMKGTKTKLRSRLGAEEVNRLEILVRDRILLLPSRKEQANYKTSLGQESFSRAWNLITAFDGAPKRKQINSLDNFVRTWHALAR